EAAFRAVYTLELTSQTNGRRTHEAHGCGYNEWIGVEREMKAYASAATLVEAVQPQRPIIGVRPPAAEKAARWFLTHFPGTPLYAVKANDNPIVVDALYKAGIRCFDVTSLGEIEKYAHLEGRQLFCMHPIKSRHLIRRAYNDYGVRNFSLDCE